MLPSTIQIGVILYEELPNKISDQITRKLSGKLFSLIEATTTQWSCLHQAFKYVPRAGDLASPNPSAAVQSQERW